MKKKIRGPCIVCTHSRLMFSSMGNKITLVLPIANRFQSEGVLMRDVCAASSLSGGREENCFEQFSQT